MNLKSKIFLISGLLFLMGCTSVENKVLDIPTYSKGKKVYSVLDDKPINGVMEKGGYNRSKEYYTYKKGTLSNLKIINMSNELILNQSFDHMGLLQGEATEKSSEFFYGVLIGEKSSEFFHGVLDGEVRYEEDNGNKIVERYSDGVLNGIQEAKDDKKLFFSQGIRAIEDTQSTTKRRSKTAVWGEIPKENFTGELYGKPKKDIKGISSAEFQIEEYKNGGLFSRRYYDKKGKKLGEFNFADGDIKKIIKSIKYKNGILMELKNYDSDGNLNGKSFTGGDYLKLLFIENFIKGIPHGRLEMLIEKNEKLEKVSGFFDKGVYTGFDSYTDYYKDGIRAEKAGTDMPPSNLIITDITDIVDKKIFSGYTVEGINNEKGEGKYLYNYDNGILKEKYQYKNNSLIQLQIYQKGGGYIQKNYENGILKGVLNYNANGVANGKITTYEHEDSKTTGNMVNGVIDGKSVHYHGDKIFYIDVYNKGKENKRTSYYNYDKKQIRQIRSTINRDRMWIGVGLEKTYYENGKLKKIVNYGESLSSTKQVRVTEYYPNGEVSSRGTMNYWLNYYIGKKTEFYSDGIKKLEENYENEGLYVGVQKYYFSNGKIKRIENYNGNAYNVGIKKYYFSNGKMEKIENYNEEGYRDGTFKTYNKDGKLIKEEQYKNGSKIFD